MYGRLKQLHEQLTIHYILVFFLAPTSIPIEASQEISQSLLKQNEIVRNAKSKEILKYMQLNADPCQDFYTYACGNWAKYHASNREPEHEAMTALRVLEEKVKQDIVNMLEDQAPLSDSFNGRKVKDFYKSCKQAVSYGLKQQVFHSDVIKNHGGFPAAPASNWALFNPDYDWQDVVARLRKKYSMDILIGIDVVVNPYNKLENIIYFTEPSTILPAKFCSTKGTKLIEVEREEYERIEREIATNLKRWLSLEEYAATKVAGEILLFEFELCTHMGLTQASNANEANDLMSNLRGTLYELTNHFNGSIDFYKFLTTCCTHNYVRPVVVHAERYFKHLIHTISIHDKAMLANYIMYRAISMLSFPLLDNKRTRPKFCAQTTMRYFPQVVGSMYYHKYANHAAKSEVERIFDKLKIAFEHSLKSPWLQDWTSRKGLEKLQNIVLHFPTYEVKPNLNNLSINADNFWRNLNIVMYRPQQHESERIRDEENNKPSVEVEAYEVRMKYQIDFMRIDVGWALLQPPFFQEVYPQSVHYATIGQMIAHQLAAAFDDIAWNADFLNIANWDPTTALEYFNRTECFRRQLSFYLSNNAHTFQNITQLRELTKISSSFNVAFAAYLNWLDYLNPYNDYEILRKETLPDLNFSNTQLFLIAFAQLNCQNEHNQRTASACCPLQSHTLARYRVNEPFLNSFEFGREFHCKIGSQMNAAEKCTIY